MKHAIKQSQWVWTGIVFAVVIIALLLSSCTSNSQIEETVPVTCSCYNKKGKLIQLTQYDHGVLIHLTPDAQKCVVERR